MFQLTACNHSTEWSCPYLCFVVHVKCESFEPTCFHGTRMPIRRLAVGSGLRFQTISFVQWSHFSPHLGNIMYRRRYCMYAIFLLQCSPLVWALWAQRLNSSHCKTHFSILRRSQCYAAVACRVTMCHILNRWLENAFKHETKSELCTYDIPHGNIDTDPFLRCTCTNTHRKWCLTQFLRLPAQNDFTVSKVEASKKRVRAREKATRFFLPSVGPLHFIVARRTYAPPSFSLMLLLWSTFPLFTLNWNAFVDFSFRSMPFWCTQLFFCCWNVAVGISHRNYIIRSTIICPKCALFQRNDRTLTFCLEHLSDAILWN